MYTFTLFEVSLVPIKDHVIMLRPVTCYSSVLPEWTYMN